MIIGIARIVHCLRDERGGAYVEYALVTALLTLVGVAALVGIVNALTVALATFDNNVATYSLGAAS